MGEAIVWSEAAKCVLYAVQKIFNIRIIVGIVLDKFYGRIKIRIALPVDLCFSKFNTFPFLFREFNNMSFCRFDGFSILVRDFYGRILLRISDNWWRNS